MKPAGDAKALVEAAAKEASKGFESDLLIATDENCTLHAPLVPDRNSAERAKQIKEQPENEERLRVLVGTPPYGILLMDDYLETDLWLNNCPAAPVSDILRVHEYVYLKHIVETCDSAAPNKCILLR